ncbi:MAG: hypothetical protein V7K55_04545 [Nostoc sp.]|uniref:hypothetical protein n=1 Tax=Nostoc sp. TaxID=1180 RepID=UPI002FF9CC06
MLAKKQIRWRRVLLVTALGTVITFAMATAFRYWQVKTQGWCVRFAPNGTQKVLYGNDCWK